MAIIQNKRLPGAYIDFISSGGTASAPFSLGKPAFLVPKSWGPDDAYVEVDGGTNFLTLLGKELKDLPQIREAFKGNGQALIYLPAYDGASKATVTIGGLVATAKHNGTLGNQLSVVITKEVNDSITVKTLLNGRTVDEQFNVSELPLENDFVTFTGEIPTASGTNNLLGGADGTLNAGAYSDFLNELENYDFSHIAIGTEDESVKSIAIAKVRELRELGRPVFLITNNQSTDYEGVTSVHNYVILEDGTKLEAKDTVYWLAGASAAAGTNSLTYATYPGAIDCERLTVDEQIQALNEGQIVFVYKNNRVRILQDINTLTTFTDTKNQDFSKNRIVRAQSVIENGITGLFEESFLGRYVNDTDGRENLKASIITTVLDPLVLNNAISYDASDITILQGQNKDTVVINLAVTIHDAMEKLYVQVICN